MIDFKSFNKALKSTCIQKYLDNDNHGKWKLLVDSEVHISAEMLSSKMIWQSLYMYWTPLQQNSKNLARNPRYNGNITSTEHLGFTSVSEKL